MYVYESQTHSFNHSKIHNMNRRRLSRKIVIAANTQFMTAKYFPTGVQCLSCGTDGRISYWMVYNGHLIRELQGSQKSSVNDIDINGTGDFFVSAGSDQMVKV